MRTRGAVANALSFALASGLTIAALGTIRPLPDRPFLRAKFEHWTAHHEDYDTIFLGSSRVLRAFDPKTYDTTMERLGTPTRSFNFGIPGMRGHEADALLRRILACEPTALRTVLLEFPDYTEKFPDGNALVSDRSVWWHDLRTTLDVLVTASRADSPLPERVADAMTHLRLAFANLTNVGGASLLLESWFVSRPKDDDRAAVMLTLNGFAPIPRGREPTNPTEEKYSDPNSRIVEEIAGRIERRHAIDDSFAQFHHEALERRIDLLESRGLRVTHVTIPNHLPLSVAYRCVERGLLRSFAPLNDPRAFSNLYRTMYFSDGAHMNDTGARAFSAALADFMVRANEH